MAYTPTIFSKESETRIAETLVEFYELTFAGWTLIGPAPEPPTSSLPATRGHVSDAVEPIQAELDGRLSDEQLSDEYAAKFVEETISDGRLSPSALSATIAARPARRSGSTGLHVGDSFTVGVGASGPAAYFRVLMDEAFDYDTATTIATSGHQAWDLTDDVSQQAIGSATKATSLLVGTNDHRTYGTDAAKYAEWKRAATFLGWWLAVPSTAKAFSDSGASSIVTTGTWATAGLPYFEGTHPVISCEGAGTVTLTLHGTTAYVALLAQTGVTSSYSITVDGRAYGTFNTAPAASMNTVNGGTFGWRAHRFPGLTPGAHTVVITAVGTAGNPVYFGAASGTERTKTDDGPQVAIGTISRFTAAGYTAAGGTDTSVALYNRGLTEVVAALASDGLNVALADTSLDRDTQLDGDGVHPNDAGHARIAEGFIEALQSRAYLRDRPAPGRPREFVGCKVTRTSSQSIGTGGFAAIQWQAETVDTHGFHDATTNPERLTIPPGQGGWYALAGSWAPGTAPGTGATRVVARLRVNGTDIPGGAFEAPGGVFTTPAVSTVALLADGDYIDLAIFHDAGGAIGTDVPLTGLSLVKLATY